MAPGKIVLLEAGAFEGVHAVMMMHPFPTPWSVYIPTVNYPRLRAEFSRADGGSAPINRSALTSLKETLTRAAEGFEQTPGLFVARPEDAEAGALADYLWVAPSLDESTSARVAVRQCFAEAASKAGASVEINLHTEEVRSSTPHRSAISGALAARGICNPSATRLSGRSCP